MKKVKSTTLNEFDLEKIRRFTEQELSRLNQGELPFCYQTGNDVLVGASKVVKITEDCWSVYEGKTHIFDFFTRKDAIFYCIAVHKKQYKVAQDIKTNDNLLGKLEFEAMLYRRRYKQANEKNDSWGSDYYSSKYTEVMHRIAHTKQELKKSLDLAKYIKL